MVVRGTLNDVLLQSFVRLSQHARVKGAVEKRGVEKQVRDGIKGVVCIDRKVISKLSVTGCASCGAATTVCAKETMHAEQQQHAHAPLGLSFLAAISVASHLARSGSPFAWTTIGMEPGLWMSASMQPHTLAPQPIGL